MTLTAIGFPSLYIQGPGALSELPRCLDAVSSASGTIGAIVDPFVEPVFRELALSMPMQVVAFGGECTQPEIDRLTGLLRDRGCTAILGAGGGKALDTAKAVAHRLSAPVMIAPTVASSDAPTSRIAAVYDEHHRIVSVPRLRRNPDAVIVDTQLILTAPARFFAAGIGDAITKKYEVAESHAAGIANFFDAAPPQLALLLADRCAEVLRQDSATALDAVRNRTPSAAFERVVEATVLYSGLAFEGGGLSIAHGLLRGLTALPGTGAVLHGELVAYGVLVQQVLAGAPAEEIAELRSFLVGIGLPVTLAGISLPGLAAAEIDEIAERTFEAPYVAAQTASRGITPATLARAIADTEGLVADAAAEGA